MKSLVFNCESRNALIPAPVYGVSHWDHLLGCFAILQHGLPSAADSARMDHTKTPRAPNPASQDQFRPHLHIPVDKWIVLPVPNLVAVPAGFAQSAPGSVCFAGAALQLLYPAQQEHKPKGFPEDKQF